MVIFHSYVSLPEGKQFNHQRRPWDPWDPIAEVVLSHGHAVPPFPLGPVRRWLEQLPSSEVSKHLGADKHRTGKFFGPKKLGEFLKNFWEFFFFFRNLKMERLWFWKSGIWSSSVLKRPKRMRFGLSHGRTLEKSHLNRASRAVS